MPTPPPLKHFHYHDLAIDVDPTVYDPAEDTYLILQIIHPQPDTTILDIGTGCGIIALACAHAGAHVTATDISLHAVRNTRRNHTTNRTLLPGTLDIRHGDLFTVLRPHERFDLIVFNPPYVPTHPTETTEDWLDLATSGGTDGLTVTARFLTDLHRYLKPNGTAYFIASSRSPQECLHRLIHDHHLHGTIASQQSFEDETLLCYRLAPTD